MRIPVPMQVRRVGSARHALVRGDWNTGTCPLCEGRTVFVELGPWLRDQYRCLRCWSRPRHRALTTVLEERFPEWPSARVHEFAPSPTSIDWFRRRCPRYSYSQFWPDVPLGETRNGVRCEDLARLTFADDELDLVITQDVFEHLPEPEAAAAEIARVLAPGGAHVFTVPIHPTPTVVRAELAGDGTIHHRLPADYHGSTVDPSGSLVFREWGPDVVDVLDAASGCRTEVVLHTDRRRGLAGEFLEVCVTPVAGRSIPVR